MKVSSSDNGHLKSCSAIISLLIYLIKIILSGYQAQKDEDEEIETGDI